MDEPENFSEDFIRGIRDTFSLELTPAKLILLAVITICFLRLILKNDPANSKKQKAQGCKMLAGILLLLSFISQNFMYEKWDSKIKETENNQNSFNGKRTSSLLFLNAYLSSATNPERLSFVGDSMGHIYDSSGKLKDTFFLRSASGELVRAYFEDILNGSTVSKERNEAYQRMLRLADSCYNLTAYLSLNNRLAKYNDTIVQANNTLFQEILTKKELASELYLGAYIIGSLVLLLGLYYE